LGAEGIVRVMNAVAIAALGGFAVIEILAV
jgi:hypothetical protein